MEKTFYVAQKHQNAGNGINGGSAIINQLLMVENITTDPNVVLTKQPDSINWNHVDDSIFNELQTLKKYKVTITEVADDESQKVDE